MSFVLKMTVINCLLLIILLTGCETTRLTVASIDTPEAINSYKPVTPILVGRATGTVVAIMKKSNEIADDMAQAIIKELCSVPRDYREYWIKRQWKKNGIDYRRACESLDGDIIDPMR